MIEPQENPTEIQTCQEQKKKYVCRECKEETDNFNPSRIKYRDFICKKCFKQQHNKRAIEIKRKSVEYKGGKCCVCNYNKYQGALDFHHIDPNDKDFTIGDVPNWSFNSIKSELDKCVLLCKNCHAEVHAGLINLDKIGSPAGI